MSNSNIEELIIDNLKKQIENLNIYRLDLSAKELNIENTKGRYHLAIVTNPELLEYQDLEDILSSIYSLLTDDGVLLLYALNPENIKISTQTIYNRATQSRLYTIDLMQSLAKETGFKRGVAIREAQNEYIETKRYFDLFDVINSVSSKYVLIAQKSSEKIEYLEDIFLINSGISLDEALSRFERREINDKKHIDIIKAKIDEQSEILDEEFKSFKQIVLKNKDALYRVDKEKEFLKSEIKILNSRLEELSKENKELRNFVYDLAKDHDGLSKAFHNLYMHVSSQDNSCYAIKQCLNRLVNAFRSILKKKDLTPKDIKNKSSEDKITKKEILTRPTIRSKPILLNSPKSRASNLEKLKLAYFSPFEPAKSGIATYTTELLPYLAKYYDITLVADSSNLDAKRVYGGIEFPLISVDEFMDKKEEFDRILHHIGNSRYHIYSCKVLDELGGVIVLHDFFLSGMQKYREFEEKEYRYWGLSLFRGHGYLPFRDYFDEKNFEELSFDYPVNLQPLQNSIGVITHSNYAKNLSKEWYINKAQPNWRVIPHLRTLKRDRDKIKARAKLGIDKDAFIISSFGHINKTKLSHKLLEAFIASSLSKEDNIKLIFAGARSDPNYCEELEKLAKKEGIEDKVLITGWIEMEEFDLYLQASDIAVQLRTLSRGETSGTVLDALSYGIPVIVNANGSMAEIDKDAVYMLEDNFRYSDLIEALDRLYHNEELREELSKRAKEYIDTHHKPEFCAKLYKDAIEEFYQAILDDRSILQEAKPRQRQILVDVSTLVENDLRTGVQRVVRAQLLQLMQVVPKSWRVEGVYLSLDGKPHYRYASEYICNLLNIPATLTDKEVEVERGDIFYGVDLYRYGVIQAAKAGIYQEWRQKGVYVSFTIHDLLPIYMPQFFPEGTKKEHIKWLEVITKNSDMLVCTSNTGVKITKEWIKKLSITPKKMPKIVSVYLGADISSSAPDGSVSKYSELIEQMSKRPLFLMVGTVEPRKGHLQTINAFKKLWSQGVDVSLVVVGKEGWVGLPDEARRNLPQTIKALKEAEAEYSDRFRWLRDVDDVSLEEFYKKATAFLFASEDEGFGIPLIEAAHYGLPLLVRDKEIFRELASEYAEYFEDTLDADRLANAIKEWLDRYKEGKVATSKGMPYITWQESAKRLYSEFEKLVSKD